MSLSNYYTLLERKLNRPLSERKKPQFKYNIEDFSLWYKGRLAQHHLNKMANLMNEWAHNSSCQDIILYMDSGGGELSHVIAFIARMGLIQKCGIRITMVCSEFCGSAATWIMANCDRVIFDPTAKILIHESNMYNQTDRNKKFKSMYSELGADIYNKVSGFAKSEWMDILNSGKDAIFTSNSMYQLGIVSEIAPVDKVYAFTPDELKSFRYRSH